MLKRKKKYEKKNVGNVNFYFSHNLIGLFEIYSIHHSTKKIPLNKYFMSMLKFLINVKHVKNFET